MAFARAGAKARAECLSSGSLATATGNFHPTILALLRDQEVECEEENRKGYDEAVGRLEEFFFRSPI